MKSIPKENEFCNPSTRYVSPEAQETVSAVPGSSFIPLTAIPATRIAFAVPVKVGVIGYEYDADCAEIMFGFPEFGKSPVSWFGKAFVCIVRIPLLKVTVVWVP